MAKTMQQLEMLFSQEELALIRAQRAAYARKYRERLGADERRRRRALYELHTAQRKAQERENAAEE